MQVPDIIFILFLFALGACIGSFLNVVAWRLPRNESLVTPPSHCPKCDHRLAWYDNIPIFGWIALRGRCRYCKNSISPRYPIIEAVTAGLFAFYYIMFFMTHVGPCASPSADRGWSGFGGMTSLPEDWPIYFIYMLTIAGLLVASLIDAELFIIPIEIPWLLAGVGIVVHAIVDRPGLPGAVLAGESTDALSAGAAIGLMVSIALWWVGKMPVSFPQGEPILEVDRAAMEEEIRQAAKEGRELPPLPPEYSPRQIRGEIRKEMLFLMPPLLLGGISVVLQIKSPLVHKLWHEAASCDWLSGLLGALLGGMVGGFVVWITRIFGTLGFGRVAMGLGDVHLMFGVGAVLGGGPATVAFFIAPFFGIAVAIYMLLTGTRRELPYGPYLSLATAFVMLFYCPIAAYLMPGMVILAGIIRQSFGG